MTARRVLALAAALGASCGVSAAAAEPARDLCYSVTSTMWTPDRGDPSGAVPTSPEVIARIRGAFQLWAQASLGKLAFREVPSSAEAYDGKSQVPYDGCIHVVLAGDYNFHGELGFGGFNGAIPTPYKRGYVFLNRTAGAHTSGVIVHEIGHALGLPHAATPASALWSGTRAWDEDPPSALVEQDGVDLRARWAPDSVYAIRGKVETKHEHAVTFVFAVDPRNGHTYSARSDHQGRFAIALSRPGDYQLVAKAAEVSRDLAARDRQQQIPHSPSWYVAAGISSSDPARGALLTVSAARRAIEELSVAMIDRPTLFPLARARCVAPSPRAHMRLAPGTEATVEVEEIAHELESLASYGTEPDVTVLDLKRVGGGRYRFRVYARPDAAEGERLIVARARDGRSTVGLIGIHVARREEVVP